MSLGHQAVKTGPSTSAVTFGSEQGLDRAWDTPAQWGSDPEGSMGFPGRKSLGRLSKEQDRGGVGGAGGLWSHTDLGLKLSSE